MAFFFNRMPSPRRFFHPYIYVDERRERITAMKEKARRELSLSAGERKPLSRRRRDNRLAAENPWRKRSGRSRMPGSLQWGLLVMLLWLCCYLFSQGWPA